MSGLERLTVKIAGPRKCLPLAVMIGSLLFGCVSSSSPGLNTPVEALTPHELSDEERMVIERSIYGAAARPASVEFQRVIAGKDGHGNVFACGSVYAKSKTGSGREVPFHAHLKLTEKKADITIGQYSMRKIVDRCAQRGLDLRSKQQE